MTNIEHTISVGTSQTVTVTFQAPQLGLKCFKLRADGVPNFGSLFQDVILHVEHLLGKTNDIDQTLGGKLKPHQSEKME